MKRRHRVFAASVLAGGLLGSAAGVADAGKVQAHTRPAAVAHGNRHSPTPAAGIPVLHVPGTALVAQIAVPVAGLYGEPDALIPESRINGANALGVPTVLLVARTVDSWTQVYVPVRPNGKLLWIRNADATFARDPFSIRVSVMHHRLTVYDGTKTVLSVPAATGTAKTPTPLGTFFLTELLRQPDPAGAYGPYAYGLSAYSNVLSSFGGGPGQIGLHGTDDPGSVGRSASNGCIRVHNDVIERLAGILPLGTPIVISA